MKEKILLGLSGGLDSTYAARVLSERGYEVEGAVLKMHEYTDTAAAEASAAELGIPLHIIDCRDAFSSVVVSNFLDEYTAARTPNPCIVCNREVKFRFLYEYAMENGFDKIATGHYADVVKIGEGADARFAVKRAGDLNKDQTYMLYRLSQEQLSKLVLPLSDMKKDDIRENARLLGLSAAEKRDSQEICFIPDGDYASYVEERCGAAKRGSFVDVQGNVVGAHEGLLRYTIGQRKGLGVALGARAFVREIDPVANTVTLGYEPKMSRTVYISDMVFSGIKKPDETLCIPVSVKLRYKAPAVFATAEISSDGKAKITLDAPFASVTPGQSAVLYDGDLVLAGGFIDRSEL